MNKPSAQRNIESISLVAHRLQELRNEVTFVGGSIIGLLITDTAAPDVRFTIDVDCIVDIVTQIKYHAFSEKLREKGFKELPFGPHPICRWDCDGVLIDIVPIDENVLGFSNKWYKDALKNSIIIKINEVIEIKIISAPYFIATKLEAFLNRGKNDFLSSHDIEDVITILDGRVELVDDMKKTPHDLIEYISSIFLRFINNDQFLHALPGHLNYTYEYESRNNTILDRIKAIIDLGK